MSHRWVKYASTPVEVTASIRANAIRSNWITFPSSERTAASQELAMSPSGCRSTQGTAEDGGSHWTMGAFTFRAGIPVFFPWSKKGG